LNDLTNAGFSGGLGLGYVFNRAVGIRADFAGEWLKGQDPVVSPLPDIDQAFFGRDVNLYHYDASIMINATDPRQTNWIVAIDAGAGATTIQFRGDELDRPDSETRFTIPVGLGVGYLVSETVGVFRLIDGRGPPASGAGGPRLRGKGFLFPGLDQRLHEILPLAQKLHSLVDSLDELTNLSYAQLQPFEPVTVRGALVAEFDPLLEHSPETAAQRKEQDEDSDHERRDQRSDCVDHAWRHLGSS
jgi:hypothetical protein